MDEWLKENTRIVPPPTPEKEDDMEKTSDDAWKMFKQSSAYARIHKSLTELFKSTYIPDPEGVAELTINTCFVQGYIYRNL